jgi:dihydrofolate reductase
VRKIIYWMNVSLDGFFEGPNHDLSWHKGSDELLLHAIEESGKMSAYLNGRRTQEMMAGFWPRVAQLVPGKKLMADYGQLWLKMPKVVYSRTLQDAGGHNSTLVRSVVPAEVQALKNLPGGDMVLGGAELAAEFMRLGLVDEQRIYVHPVILGEGKPAFGAGVKAELALKETKTFGNGVVMLRYAKES